VAQFGGKVPLHGNRTSRRAAETDEVSYGLFDMGSAYHDPAMFDFPPQG